MIDRGTYFAQELRGHGPYERLASLLTAGPVVVAADPGALELELVETAAARAGLTPIVVDARRAGNRYGLVADVARALLAQLAPSTELAAHHVVVGENDRLTLAQAFGADVDDAIGAAMGLPGDDWTLDSALGAFPPGSVLVVRHAHLLTQKWAQRALWIMRGYAAELGLPIALMTRPWHVGALLNADAAFFGFAEQVAAPAAIDRTAVSGLSEIEAELAVLMRRSDFQLAAAVELLAARRPGESVEDVYERLVADRVRCADQLLTVAQRLTPLGARLLAAIARDEPPYRSATRAVPGRVANGLNALRDAELLHSPEPRRWTISDPISAEALRRFVLEAEPTPIYAAT